MEKTKALVDDIVQFISEFKPVLDDSTVNFYTSNMWDHNVDCELACQLLRLTDAELAVFPTGQVRLQNEHNTMDGEFSALREFMEQTLSNRLETMAFHVECVAENCLEKDCSKDGIHRAGQANSVGCDARRYGQEQTHGLVNAAASQEQELKENRELTKWIMGKKKSHEVALMALKCANMLCTQGIKQVIDIGSGKGYLGQFLSMQYGFSVISVDSSETNTNGALKRSNRLSKQWRGIIRNATQRQNESDAEPVSNNKDCRTVGRNKNCSEETCDKDGCLVGLTRNGEGEHMLANGVNKMTINEGTASLSSLTSSKPLQYSSSQNDTPEALSSSVLPVTPSRLPSSSASSPSSTSVSNYPQLGNSSSCSKSLASSSSVSCRPISSTPSSSSATQATTDCEISSPLSNSTATSDSQPPKTSPPSSNLPNPQHPLVTHTQTASSQIQDDGQMETHPHEKVLNDTPAHKTEEMIQEGEARGQMPAAFASVTGYIDEETEIGEFLQCDENARHFDLTQPFMMVGLHTCGDLAPSMLRIFQSNPSMHCLCNVGCCYHHITEEFARIDEWDREHPGVKMGSSYGFPMSAYLKKKKVALGRGARMTACMAADRISSEKTVDVKGLFYRAVLQVICRDCFTIPTRKQMIGKLAPKCKSFLEYTRRALKKLKMDDTKLSDEEIGVYEAKYRPYYRHLAAYNQLKAALAPSIEALILLDRLLYLEEQPNIKTASVVRMFDPVTSPRCYGIIAVKETNC